MSPLSPNTKTTALLLQEDATTQVLLHTMPLFHILDHHSRRDDDRVIGTLLGRRDGKTIEITNCFAIPHKESGEEVAIGKDFDRTMLHLHLRACNAKETVVGWYASGGIIADTSYLIHEFYAGQTEDGDPIHVVVDTRLEQDTLPIKAYKSTPVMLQGESMANVFHEMNIVLKSSEPETICLHEMIRGGTVAKKKKNEPLALQASIEQLHGLLESTLDYVNAVVDGTIEADEEKGRKIADTLACVPRMRPEALDEMFHDTLQDLLMVTYLSNITRTQLEVAEKLNATLGSG